jgi:hypothetical protein
MLASASRARAKCTRYVVRGRSGFWGISVDAMLVVQWARVRPFESRVVRACLGDASVLVHRDRNDPTQASFGYFEVLTDEV